MNVLLNLYFILKFMLTFVCIQFVKYDNHDFGIKIIFWSFLNEINKTKNIIIIKCYWIQPFYEGKIKHIVNDNISLKFYFKERKCKF